MLRAKVIYIFVRKIVNRYIQDNYHNTFNVEHICNYVYDNVDVFALCLVNGGLKGLVFRVDLHKGLSQHNLEKQWTAIEHNFHFHFHMKMENTNHERLPLQCFPSRYCHTVFEPLTIHKTHFLYT